jgi:Flp pilus assembly pilin Flp
MSRIFTAVELAHSIRTEAIVKHKLLKFLSNDSGATAIENGLGTNLNGMFASVNNSLK